MKEQTRKEQMRRSKEVRPAPARVPAVRVAVEALERRQLFAAGFGADPVAPVAVPLAGSAPVTGTARIT